MRVRVTDRSEGHGGDMTEPVPTTNSHGALLTALEDLRAGAEATALELETPHVAKGRAVRHELVAQLDDYVLPRLRSLDAPLLVVVGGSTGAGKSTLVNSILGRRVTTSGVLRPTTRAPVLVHHPDDAPWFTGQRILPDMTRSLVPMDSRVLKDIGQPPHTTGLAADPSALQLVAEDAVPRGIAIVDAPDIDSVVTANRDLAAQLLAAADLWIFVTSAARYADAVPWDTLRTAAERGTVLAVVLDRVPPDAIAEVREDLAHMLAAQHLGDAPLFAVAEATLEDGMIPAAHVANVRDWLRGLAADAASRAAVARMTLDGALDSLHRRVGALAAAADEQAGAAVTLRATVRQAYAGAEHAVEEGMTDGSLLRGEVLARWQEFVGTGELLRALEVRVGRLRDRAMAALRGQSRPPEHDLAEAMGSGIESLVRAAADKAAEQTVHAWDAHPAGRPLLAAAGGDQLSRSSAELPERGQRAVRDWQGAVLDLVRSEGQEKRTTARFLAYGINGLALALMVAVFASTAGLTGTEVAVAGGTSALGQKVLEAVLGDQAVRRLTERARADLRERVDALLALEEARFLDVLAGVHVDPGSGDTLRAAVRAVGAAR